MPGVGATSTRILWLNLDGNRTHDFVHQKCIWMVVCLFGARGEWGWCMNLAVSNKLNYIVAFDYFRLPSVILVNQNTPI